MLDSQLQLQKEVGEIYPSPAFLFCIASPRPLRRVDPPYATHGA